ncbi:helix-turn-helix domain-containing protein [Streptomyces atratus]|uniref:helix-turn-helix domain-containing protein n=1 Tax=Streptomyces atratus TaxID=1893 RepID=UPI002AC35A60|nr:helix-turn-helix domain-containing protein [Streptomyces atratus]WPW30796.1 helix-turn-helix domain-containing protein [Streptomyces atratus]
MDTQQISAPSRAPSPVRGDATPSSGVVHINSRHTSHFTVVGNHLAQHRELSLLAIGLATHIQSLPAGTKVGIKPLTERFPDSEARIAAALRELEAHGYLKRTRERLPDGRVITRTCSYNQPGSTNTRPVPAPKRRPKPAHPAPAPGPQPAEPPCIPTPTAPKPPPPPLPQPRNPLPQHQHAALTLLTDLHHHTPQLTLTESDVHHLAPAVATWFERGATPTTLRHALTTNLPHPLKCPAKLLRHRLTHLLPPPRVPVHQPTPLQNCDRCDRAFRSPAPGNCRDCGEAGGPPLME